MKNSIFHRVLLSLSSLLFFTSFAFAADPFPGSEKLKIYVMIGMHVDFYHSWRGDTPDDAGFGLDIRVVRSSLNILKLQHRHTGQLGLLPN